MILHRMRLTDFRGIADREIDFPDRGVVVVCGPNEVGKSSMLEALDLLLEHKDRSAKQKVLAVKPTHADTGSQVEAEISTGPYRFVYRKRFHKRPQTELTVLEPVREQLTGDEAHERVQAILAETIDTRLWEAQRVLQSAATDAVSLSDCHALSRALDTAAGEVQTAAGAEEPLIDRIDGEFARYFTGTGRPAREWRAALDRLAAAEAQAAECRAAVEEVDEKVRRHEELSALRRDLADRLTPAEQRLAAAEAAHQAVAGIARQVEQAALARTAAEGTRAAATAARQRRDSLAEAAGRRAATMAELQQQLAVSAADEAAAAEAADAAAAESRRAATELAAAQARMDTATVTARACADREDAAQLAERLHLLDAATAEVAQAADLLAAISLTPETLAAIEAAHASVERLSAELRAEAATVEFTAEADLPVTVDGITRTLEAGQTWTPDGPDAVTVVLPGLLTVRIAPGAGAAGRHAELAAVRRRLDDALAAAEVADVDAARAAERERIAAAHRHMEAAANLRGLCAGDDPERLRRKLAELHAGLAGVDAVDPAEAAEELRRAVEALGPARAAADAAAAAASTAAAERVAKAAAAAMIGDRAAGAAAESAAVQAEIEALRAEASDEQVAAAAAAADAAWLAAEAASAALEERYRAADPDGVATELAAARADAERLRTDLADADRTLATITAHLEVMGGEGRQGRLDDAEAELRRARAEHDRIGERAAAVQLLRETMSRYRDSTRQRYVLPYRRELERLGRIVFNDSFEVEVDSALTIRSRTLDGRTVPFESLSGGAREQLGILARLAGASLVAADDTVPVVIDDALGFSDSERLERMGTVFDRVGGRGQVIVLTCQRDRYAGITDATVIALGA